MTQALYGPRIADELLKLMLHNEYDNWQANAVYGDDQPTDPTILGSASNEAMKMIYDDQDWAIVGSLNSDSTHLILRVSLKAEDEVRRVGLH
jgi:hypothetical protein